MFVLDFDILITSPRSCLLLGDWHTVVIVTVKNVCDLC